MQVSVGVNKLDTQMDPYIPYPRSLMLPIHMDKKKLMLQLLLSLGTKFIYREVHFSLELKSPSFVDVMLPENIPWREREARGCGFGNLTIGVEFLFNNLSFNIQHGNPQQSPLARYCKLASEDTGILLRCAYCFGV